MNKIIDKYYMTHANNVNNDIENGLQPYGHPVCDDNGDIWQAMVTYRDVEFFDKGYVRLLLEERESLLEEKKVWLEKREEHT